MKKVVFEVIFLVLLGIMIFLFLFSSFKLNETKNKKSDMNKEISTLNSEIEKAKIDNESLNDELNELRENSKNKLEDVEIWKKAQEKLNQAL